MRRLGAALRGRSFAVAAAGLVAAEAITSLVARPHPALALLGLVLAPGMALGALLPAPLRRDALARLAMAPAVGLAAMAVGLVSMASAGMGIEEAPVRAFMVAILVMGLLLPERGGGQSDAAARIRVWHALAVPVVLVLAAALQARVISSLPVPGNDWAKYLLYADRIGQEDGRLLIDNPFWMLGVPFREDPGMPAIHAGFLAITHARPAILQYGILATTAATALGLFAWVRAYWGAAAGMATLVLAALLPLNLDLLGWHGAANSLGFAVLPLLFAYLAALLRAELRGLEHIGFGLVLVALAAAHRLSFGFALAVLAVISFVAVASPGRRRAASALGFTALAALALCPGVAYDLLTRADTFGGMQDYHAYLSSKIDFALLARDLTWPFTVAAVAATTFGVTRARHDRAVAVLLVALAGALALGLSWIVHVPVHYTRLAYFLPLALAPLVAIAVIALPWRRTALVALAVLAAVLAVTSWTHGPGIRDFYGFANTGSLRGLDAVAGALEQGEAVVTDRCWSFLSAWLVQHPMIGALEPADIQPKAEVVRAREAREVLAGTAEGVDLIERHRIRFALVDPACTDARRRFLDPPAVGEPVFVSRRLVVLRLP